MTLTPFEWRVLRDIACFGISGRGEATQPAMARLLVERLILGPNTGKPVFVLTDAGKAAYEAGEPVEPVENVAA